MTQKYIWLKTSFFIEQDRLQDFYIEYIIPFNLEIEKDATNVYCYYNSLSTTQGSHLNLSILHSVTSAHAMKLKVQEFFLPYFKNKVLQVPFQSKEINILDLWKPFDNYKIYFNIFYLKIESKYPHVFNTFSRYKVLTNISKTLDHIMADLSEVDFTNLMEVVILSYYFLINTKRIDMTTLQNHIAYLEDRNSLYTEDIYVNLISMLEADVHNNADFLEECKSFSNAPPPYDLKWLNHFSETIVELEVSCDKKDNCKDLLSEYALLFINTLGMSPLKEIYSLHLLKSHLKQQHLDLKVAL